MELLILLLLLLRTLQESIGYTVVDMTHGFLANKINILRLTDEWSNLFNL